jgi:hypothetical protein|tara:strand:- start:242 stop:400 length:159 start_codon:yes stop_codon:yes gene_type:complete
MNFITDLKKLIIKYYLKLKAKWIGFVTDVKIMIGIKPKPKKKGRPPKVKKNG